MPKKNKRAKGGGGGSGQGIRPEPFVSDDESFCNDDASIISNVSSGSLCRDEDDTANGEEVIVTDTFEEKMKEAMELATQKSAEGRTKALQSMCRAFIRKVAPGFVSDRRVTLSDLIEKSLKRGKLSEQIAASTLASLTALQLGEDEELLSELRPTMVAMLLDDSVSTKARAAIATSLGVLVFLAKDPLDPEYIETMAVMRRIFSKTNKNKDVNISEIIAEAISSWSLLTTLISPEETWKCLATETENGTFSDLLEFPDVEVRIACGEALIVLYDSCVEEDENRAFAMVEPLMPQLKELATDSHKYRSKKDRKEQKSIFREVLKSIDDSYEVEDTISFNSREVLEINSWSQKKQYDMLCKVLTSGMNLHLTENELVRDIFQLGPPVPQETALHTNKPTKLERHTANQYADKVRNISRAKHRDKRSAVL